MSNSDTVRNVYDAFAKGDVATVLGAMDDHIDWQEPASLPFENQSSPGAVAENIFGPLLTSVEDFSITTKEIVDAGDVVFTIGVYNGKGTATGVPLDADFVHVWRFGGDGKITGFRTYTDTCLWLEVLGQH